MLPDRRFCALPDEWGGKDGAHRAQGSREASVLRVAIKGVAAGSVAALCFLAAAFGAAAQEKFPSRPIEIIATAGPGGGEDGLARKMAQLLAPVLGVPVTVSNVPGRSGNVGLKKVLDGAADGYTLATLVSSTVSAWAWGVADGTPENFRVVAWATNSPSMLFVSRHSPFRTIDDLTWHAKKNPHKLLVSTSGYGTPAEAILKSLGGLGYPMHNVPFAIPSDRYDSLRYQQTNALYEEPGDVAVFLRLSEFRPLVVFDQQRHWGFKDVPSSFEVGLPLVGVPDFRTIAVPAGTPTDRVLVLTQAFDRILDSPEWKVSCMRTFNCTERKTGAEAAAEIGNFHRTLKNYQRKVPGT